jgi:cytochrome c556
MRKTMIALACFVLSTGTAVMAQQNDPIKQRQALMKNNQEQLRTLTGIARGQAPFDANVVRAAMQRLEQNATQIPPLFPPNSQTGETSALPVIWQQKADFDARAMKLAQDARTGITRVTNPATLQAELQVIGQNCGGCHQVYRKPQPQ